MSCQSVQHMGFRVWAKSLPAVFWLRAYSKSRQSRVGGLGFRGQGADGVSLFVSSGYSA